MKLNRFKLPLILMMILAFGYACNSWDDWNDPPKDVKGYKPVYMPREAAYTVSVASPQTLVKPGKIYIYHNLLFIVERLQGIHVYNNADPSNPLPVAFIKVPGCNDVAVSGGILYADNVTDLVAFDISNPVDIKLAKRLPGQFPGGMRLYPEQARGEYFECADTTKGVIIDWEYTTLNNPKCYR